MVTKREICVIFLYEFKKGTSAAKTAEDINIVFGEGFVNSSTNEDRGRPASVVDNNHFITIIEAYSQQTARRISEDLGVLKDTVCRHLKQIGKTKKLDQWVPHELTEKQKNSRIEICFSLLLRNKNDPFLDRIVTCEEKCILYDNRKRAGQWLDKAEALKQFPKPQITPKKVMVTVWWSSKGLIHYKFMKPGETINSESYCAKLEKMHQILSKQRLSLVNRKCPILLHDNKLNDSKYEILPLPSYSPDFASTDFHFLKNLDQFLKDKFFKDEEAIKIAFEEFIASREVNFYANGINKLVSC
uniref:Histone-lysine N-methyltransferase SETMAR (inferred by orthology to a human protein) n=1 Tax=Strongyloides venezuelensis TaxID=75913 RepID=A0A0K0FST4_STRVS